MIKSFTYTNNRGVTTARVVYVTGKPSKFVSGVDLSELTEEEQGVYISEASRLYAEYMERVAELNTAHDLTNSYRQFDPDKMQNIKTETI